MAVNTFDNKTPWWVGNGTATSFTLPFPCDVVNSVVVLTPGTDTTVTTYTVSSSAPSTSTVQFTGSPGNPASTITFESAPASGALILADVVPAGVLG